MNRTLTALVGLGLLLTACSSDGDDTDAAPNIVVDGETVSAGEQAADATPPDSDADTDETNTDGTDGTPSDAGESTSESSDEELALEFARCMRDSGVPDFPDPSVAADGSITLVPDGAGSIDPDDPALQSAFDECGSIIDGASFLPGADLDDQEIEDNLLAMAQCLRDLGNDVEDPDLSAGLTPGPAGLTTIFGPNFDPTDPANSDDIATCQASVFGPGGPPLQGDS